MNAELIRSIVGAIAWIWILICGGLIPMMKSIDDVSDKGTRDANRFALFIGVIPALIMLLAVVAIDYFFVPINFSSNGT